MERNIVKDLVEISDLRALEDFLRNTPLDKISQAFHWALQSQKDNMVSAMLPFVVRNQNTAPMLLLGVPATYFQWNLYHTMQYNHHSAFDFMLEHILQNDWQNALLLACCLENQYCIQKLYKSSNIGATHEYFESKNYEHLFEEHIAPLYQKHQKEVLHQATQLLGAPNSVRKL